MDVVEIFFSFADEDRAFYHKLREQLSVPERNGHIRCRSREDVQVGEDFACARQRLLEETTILVLLISPTCVAASEQYQEQKLAIARRDAGQARVVPVLLKPGNYAGAAFDGLQMANTTPISQASNADKAYSEIAATITKLAQQQTPPASSNDNNRVWTVPYPRNRLFTGREAELQAIEAALREGQNAAIAQAISGLGGLGKTQLALEYAYRHRDEYRYIFWMLADTHSTLSAEYSKVAELLDLPGKNQAEQRYIVEAVKSWLEKNAGWLLILDNADDLELLGTFLPTTLPGQLLLTTRAHALGRLARRIEIKKLSDEEGSRFLLHRSGLLAEYEPLHKAHPNDCKLASEIVRELDALPLALDQAGAYIEETSCGLPGYLALYRKQRKVLLKERGGLVADHPESVASTWQLAFERVEKADPAAADLLRLCAFFAPDDIPEMIIVEGEAELTGPLKKLARNPAKFNAAIAALQKYSLISRNPDTQTLDVHRLVQAVLRDKMTKNVERAWAVRTMRVLNRVFPWPGVKTWEVCRKLLPHVRECAALIEHWGIDMVEGAHLLQRAGKYFRDRAEYSEAQKYNEKALAIHQKVLGEEHPETASSLNNLANVYQDQGKYEQAEVLHQQALAIYQKILGEKHPAAFNNLNNLANVYGDQGKYKQAEALHQQMLVIRRKVLGEEHPETASSLNNLANVYQDQGKYEQAEVLHQQALAIWRKVSGEEHPETAGSLSNLAAIFFYQGKYAEAEALLKQSLAIRQKVLGNGHPDTASNLTGLGKLYQTQKKYAEAETLLLQALAIQRKMLGEVHPDTALTLNNLGEVYQAQRRFEEAQTLHQQALAIRRKVLGEAHPDIAESLHNLGQLYYEQERYKEALPLFEQALAIRREKLVPEHPATRETQESYEGILRRLKG